MPINEGTTIILSGFASTENVLLYASKDGADGKSYSDITTIDPVDPNLPIIPPINPIYPVEPPISHI